MHASEGVPLESGYSLHCELALVDRGEYGDSMPSARKPPVRTFESRGGSSAGGHFVRLDRRRMQPSRTSTAPRKTTLQGSAASQDASGVRSAAVRVGLPVRGPRIAVVRQELGRPPDATQQREPRAQTGPRGTALTVTCPSLRFLVAGFRWSGQMILPGRLAYPPPLALIAK